MNLATAFIRSAESCLDKPAVFWGDTEVTYRDYLGQTLWLSHHLNQAFGIAPGDRVGIWLKNCPAFITALFGILRTGAVAVPINNFLKPSEVAYIAKDAGIKVLITDETLSPHVAEITNELPHLQSLQVEQFEHPKDFDRQESPDQDHNESDLAVLIYTSGTTGHPKGAMLSHGNLLHNVESCRHELDAANADRIAVILPMFHSFMMTVGIFLPMLMGGSIVLVKSLHPPKNILAEIIAKQATVLPAIPQLFRAFANAQLPENLPLRLCISGAAPLPVEVLHLFNQNSPIPLIEGYGLSEASPVVALNPIRGKRKPGSIGVPIRNVDVSIQDDNGQPLKPGEIGELCVRGGNVMQGYWNNQEDTAKALVDGWLRTGDVGYCDDDGYFYITDRKKDMLLVNGINVYPREIEEIIYQLKGVKEAAVVSQSDSRRGEIPVAFVAQDESETIQETEILSYLRDKLADYKIPRKVVFMDALPRNATGKILKTELRKQLS